MNVIKLSDYIADEADPDKKAALEREVNRATVLSGGRRFDNVQIKSVAEMGEAAGQCRMCTGEIRLREDIVDQVQAHRGRLAEVLVHEGEHAAGNGLEGMTELAQTLKTGATPVPAYRGKVEHARHVAGVIGRREALELAREDDAPLQLVEAYTRARMLRGVNQEQAQKEAEWRVQQAA